MIKHFYSFIVETDSLFLEIDSLTISENEKKHLKSLAESHIHHGVLDGILSELTHDGKKEFLKHLNTRDHEKIWKFLNNNIVKAEEKIQKITNSIKSELLRDLKEEKSA
jgi:hypothetical protein